MYQDLTKGKIGKTLILFALPMMAGNFLQQFYNIADTLIVGRVLGRNALAAVGSAYTLMTFLTSIFLGFSMGAGALFSIYYGKGDKKALSEAITQGFLLNMGVTIVVNVMVYVPEALTDAEKSAIESMKGSPNIEPTESTSKRIFSRLRHIFNKENRGE